MNNNIDFDDEILLSLRKLNYYNYAKSKGYALPYGFSNIEKEFIESLIPKDLWQKYVNKVGAIGQRKWRLKLRVDYMLNNYNCMFITFTLNNDSIKRTFKYLREKICRMLKQMNCYYVGNVDYGSDKGRLHFHFIVASDDWEFIKENYPFGIVYIENITRLNSYKLTNYIDKLTNHATKGTTERYSVITSRGDYAFTDILKNYRLLDQVSKKIDMKDNVDIF